LNYDARTHEFKISGCFLFISGCATNRKVAGSIPAGVTGMFH